MREYLMFNGYLILVFCQDAQMGRFVVYSFEVHPEILDKRSVHEKRKKKIGRLYTF
jgi:hypothetical protein